MPQHTFSGLQRGDPGSKFGRDVRSTLVSRNITVSGRRTSVRLEPQMWQGLVDICRRERATIHDVCTYISAHKDRATSLTAAIRVYIMEYYKVAATEEGHMRARHGQGLLLDLGASLQSPAHSLALVAGAAKGDATSAGTFSFGASRASALVSR